MVKRRRLPFSNHCSPSTNARLHEFSLCWVEMSFRDKVQAMDIEEKVLHAAARNSLSSNKEINTSLKASYPPKLDFFN